MIKCVIAQQPSTTNQNATQGIYIYKVIKWLGKSLQAYSIKIQYENVFKSDGCCSCYTCLPQTTPAAAQTDLKMVALGTGTGAPQMDQRLLTNTWPKQRTTISIQANTNKKLRNSTSIHKNSTLNYSNTVLRVTTIAWI